MRRILLLVLLLLLGWAITLGLLILLPAPARAASRSPELRLVAAVNEWRVDHGRQALTPKPYLMDYAEQHARRIARRGCLFHSDLSFHKPEGWQQAGENLAAVYDGKMRAVVGLWEDSIPHRRNLRARVYRYTGVGVVRRDGISWVVQVYLG